MMHIRELLDKDLAKPIEEIIKVNNVDEETVYTELTEYIATDSIKQQYLDLFRAMADGPKVPREDVGVWISGFFGSGKSSFAKNLGYVLANRSVLGKSATQLFLKQLNHKRITEYVELLNLSVPCEVFMFDVQVDVAVQTNAEQIAEVMYRVLLRQLDYAEDYDIAALEMELEQEGKIDAFKDACLKRYKQDWSRVRKGAQKFSRASALLFDIGEQPSEDSWLKSDKARSTERLTVGKIVNLSFDLCARRRPGKAPVFIVDEMGQYVARSGEKLENLRAVVEQFGNVGLQRLKAHKIPGPAWIIVTAQEKLQQVYDYIASGRIDLPKLQDRFKFQLNLSPSDIREVASKRVLSKSKRGSQVLREWFTAHGATLLANCKLERTFRSTDFCAEEFVQFYPYLPHHIDLSIDIMTGLRQFGNAPQHLGGSNRTLIKQAYEILVGHTTNLVGQPFGALVTLDKVYELVHGNMPSERQKDILDIQRRFEKDTEYPDMHARVAKAVCLLEFVRDLPRTPKNIAALLIADINEPAPEGAVRVVLEKLNEAQFVRETEEGWKLQTAQEKNWQAEKRGYAVLKRSERNELLRKAIKDVIDSAKVRTFSYKNLKSFSLGLSLDGQPIPPPGQVPFDIIGLDESEDITKRQAELITESLQDEGRNMVFWLVQLRSAVEKPLADLHASNQMMFKYENLRSQNKITEQELASLQAERSETIQLDKKLISELTKCLEHGVGFFRGLRKEAGDLGKDLGEIVPALLKDVIPDLYPKLELGNRPLDEKVVDDFLKQAQLNNLPTVFFPGSQGLNLVVKEGNHFILNPNAEIAREILDYLKREHQYGNKVIGSQIADHFGGLGYGWDRDIIRLVLAVLFRAGQVEITYQGRRYKSYQEPLARVPLTNIPSFKSASFAPRESIDLKTLTLAVRSLEDLLGQEVDVEESAIADAFQKLARSEKEAALPALATAVAHGLPVAGVLRDWNETLDAVLSGASDDIVRMLAGEGNTLKELRNKAQRIRGFLTGTNLERIREARQAHDSLVPALRAVGTDGAVLTAASELDSLLKSAELPDQLARVNELAHSIDAAYQQTYRAHHQERSDNYRKVIEEIKGMSEFLQLDPSAQETVLQPLARRAVEECELPPFQAVSRLTGSTLGELVADIEAMPGFRSAAIRRMQEIIAKVQNKDARVERVRLASYFTAPKDPSRSTKENFDDALERLRERVYSLLDEGATVIWE